MESELAGVHVLLVDDNEDALEVFGTYLRHVGAMVTLARTQLKRSAFSRRPRRT